MARKDTFSYDELCELGARACRAPAAVITLFDAHEGHVKVLGRFGTINTYSRNFAIPGLHAIDRPFVSYRAVQTDRVFEGHPVRLLESRVQTLVAAVLQHNMLASRISLTVINAAPAFFDDPESFACFSQLVQHFRKLLADQCLVKAHVAMPGKRAKAAPSAIAPHPERTDPSASFLLDTLRKTQSLHSRNAASYVTVRRWRSALKPYQIAALQALKPVAPKSFLDVVTKEMAETAVHLFGNQTIAAVVPVPGGSCGAGKSLSEHLAENLAKQLDCPYRAVLRRQAAATGKSHPKKSVKLQPYEIDEKIEGIVLLVDDVATSGRHLELAQATLRNAGAVCLAMAWIGT